VTTAGLLILAAFGLIFGSFLNVCIGRLPAGESIVFPGSRCPSCRVAIRWYDNLPVLSYLMLGGRCRSCRTRISIRYPFTEIVTALAFVAQGLSIGNDPLLLGVRLFFTAILILLFGTDLETQRLPNVVTLPGIVLGFLASIFVAPGPVDSLLGIALGGGVLLAVRWGWRAATGVDGMGLGDVKMLAMIGAFLGWRLVLVVLFLSTITGAVAGLMLTVLKNRSLQHRIPFGTFLAAAAFAASLFGESLAAWYMKFYQ